MSAVSPPADTYPRPMERAPTPVVEKRVKRKRAPSITPSLYEAQSHRSETPPPPVPPLPYMGPPLAPVSTFEDYDASFTDEPPARWCDCCRDVRDLFRWAKEQLWRALCR